MRVEEGENLKENLLEQKKHLSVDHIRGEIDHDLCGFQKIKTEKSLDRALRREVMTDHLEVFNFNSKGSEFWNHNESGVFPAASSHELGLFSRTQRIAANRHGGFPRNNGGCRSRIDSQFEEKFGAASSLNFRAAENNSLVGIKWKERHVTSKSRSGSLRERIT